ncbi:MAG TPA: DUF4173 domain-containing protein [Longimicrobiales bacterium]|nr:DUF4173 domain-containing protein [Longimicrobiales bacterium]
MNTHGEAPLDSGAQTHRAAGILGAAVVMGILGVLFFYRAEGPPALNAFLWTTAGVVTIAVLLRLTRARRPSTEAMVLMAAAWAFTASWVYSDADPTRAISLFMAAVLVSLAARRAATPWLRRAGAAEFIGAGIVSWGNVFFGSLVLVRDAVVAAGAHSAAPAAWRRGTRAAIRGVALAVPLLVVFGALFISADPVFADFVGSAVRIDLEPLFERIVFAGVIAWPTAGYLRGFLFGTRIPTGSVPQVRPRLGIVEGGIPLALLDLLFLVFVLIQVRYLFGGAGLVEVTPGLTYAEYARRGFFELAAVSALTVPVLLLADWALARETPRAARAFHILAGALIALVLAIMASSLFRMRLYQQAYGLTELRLYTTASIVWTGVTLAWLAFTLWRGRRSEFTFGAFLAGVAVAGVLVVAQPHALIVKVNARRAAAGLEFDAEYATRLSADAVPPLVEALPILPAAARCHVATELLDRWGDPPGNWRHWNLSDRRARALVAANRAELAGACPAGTPPPG